MNQRKRDILLFSIELYIKTGQPISSKMLAQLPQFPVSSATIRNELSALEGEGYLMQVHTSSGRVPTDQGLRFFIEATVFSRLPEHHQQQIRSELELVPPTFKGYLNVILKLMNNLSGYASLLISPGIDEETLTGAHFVSISNQKIMAVLYTHKGIYSETMIPMPHQYEQDTLNQLSAHLSQIIKGKSVLQIPENLAELMCQSLPLLKPLIEKVSESISNSIQEGLKKHRVLLEGVSQLLSLREFQNAQDVSQIMETVQLQQGNFQGMVSSLAGQDYQVLIGKETQLSSLVSCSLVLAPYYYRDSMGALGVLGPKRMSYHQVVPMVVFFANIMNQTFEEQASFNVSNPWI